MERVSSSSHLLDYLPHAQQAHAAELLCKATHGYWGSIFPLLHSAHATTHSCTSTVQVMVGPTHILRVGSTSLGRYESAMQQAAREGPRSWCMESGCPLHINSSASTNPNTATKPFGRLSRNYYRRLSRQQVQLLYSYRHKNWTKTIARRRFMA